jgi:hypothetical protein
VIADLSRLPDRPPRGPDGWRALADLLGVGRADTLLVMSRNYDPYFKGTPAHWRNARWFAELWERFGFSDGVHLRRMHYRIVSTPDPRTAAGEPYENTEKHFHDLCVAGSEARILGLVDPEHFEDRRNPPAREYIRPRWEPPAPSWRWRDGLPWERPAFGLPTIERWQLDVDNWALPRVASWRLEAESLGWFDWPAPQVDGYDYEPADQPVLLEVWIEKTTMDDVLVPLCRDLNANLVRAAGFESLTAIIGLLRRAERHGKPAHVLYVSDFDPAGESMPVAVARQVEFWREELGIDAEVSVEQVVLTAEQVAAYRLPRIPIKKSDGRGTKFEARNGEGAVELDALEALHPGVLAEAVSRAIQPDLDPDLDDRLAGTDRHAASEVANSLAEVTRPLDQRLAEAKAGIAAVVDGYGARLLQLNRELYDAMAPYRERLAELRADVEEAVEPFRERLDELADELADELEPHRHRLDELADEAAAIVDHFDPELPDRPAPTEPDVDRSALLFDSRRHWWDQYRAFKAWQGKDAP